MLRFDEFFDTSPTYKNIIPMYGILLIMNLEIRRNCSVELIFAGNFERLQNLRGKKPLLQHQTTVNEIFCNCAAIRIFFFREIATITIYNNINFVSIS